MNKKPICFALGLFAIAAAIALPTDPYRLYGEDETPSSSTSSIPEDSAASYYVCFSSENYAIKTSNKMSKVGDHYELEDVDLTHSNSFYVTDEEGVRYYGSDNAELAVEDTESYAYNLYFSKDYLYDEDHTKNTEIKVTNAHVSYAYVNKGSFAFTLNGVESESKLTYSRFYKNYDAYTVDELELKQDDVIIVLDADSKELTTYTVKTDGNFQVIYTPDKTISGSTYRFDKDGNYGSGDDYTYNVALKANDFYYVHYFDITISDEDADATYKDYNLEKLDKDFSTSTTTYKGENHFIDDIETTIEYEIYQRVGNNYLPIDDDNDEDTVTSKLSATYPGWYHLSFSETNGVYATVLEKKDSDFKDYYLASGKGDSDFDEHGNVSTNDKRKFTLIDSSDDEYTSDYDQYLLDFYVTEENLDEKFYITDGYDYYRNGDKFITFSEVGHYKMYFSKDHLYSINQNYKFSLVKEDPTLTYIKITSIDDFKKMISDCNLETTNSISKVYILTKDLSFSGINLDSIKNFHGTFEGNYHTLSGIKLDESGEGVSFIHRLEKDGAINNLTVDDFSITSDDSDLGFISYNEGTLNNVLIKISVEGDENIGGLVAHNAKYEYKDRNNAEDSTTLYGYGTIKNCSVSGKVNGKNYVGGLVGYNEGRIYESVNEALVNVKSYSSSESINNIGGIAGYSDGEIGLSENKGKVGYENTGYDVAGVAGSGSGLYFYNTNSATVKGKRYVGGIVGIFGSLSEEDGGESNSTSNVLGNLYYEMNKGDVFASDVSGGIVGYFNGASSNIKNCLASGSIELSSGNNAGGIVGRLAAGNVESCLSYCDLTAKGTGQGSNVGGIVGYDSGKVQYCYSACFLSGNSNVGGIVGSLTNSATMESTLSDSFISYTNEDISSFGHIVGKADDIYDNDNVSYNYYVDSDSAIGGAGKVKSIGEEFDDKAATITSANLLSDGSVSIHLNTAFAGEGWTGGSGSNSYPYLRNFSFYDEVDSFSSTYEDKEEELFETYQTNFLSVEKENNCVSAIISYYEWNADDSSSKIDDKTTYICIDNIRVHSLDEVKAPAFVYAKDGVYSTDTGYYFVEWSALSDKFESQAVYATYTERITSLSTDEANSYLVEGNFEDGTTVSVSHVGNTYQVYFYRDGKQIQVENFKLRIKTSEELSFTDQNGNALTSSRVGDYLVVSVASSDVTVISSVVSHAWPIYWVITASVGGSLVGGFGLYFAILGIVKAAKKHKAAKLAKAEQAAKEEAKIAPKASKKQLSKQNVKPKAEAKKEPVAKKKPAKSKVAAKKASKAKK